MSARNEKKSEPSQGLKFLSVSFTLLHLVYLLCEVGCRITGVIAPELSIRRQYERQIWRKCEANLWIEKRKVLKTFLFCFSCAGVVTLAVALRGGFSAESTTNTANNHSQRNSLADKAPPTTKITNNIQTETIDHALLNHAACISVTTCVIGSH